MSDDSIILNGINGATGDYFTAPFTEADAVEFVSGKPAGTGPAKMLENLAQQASRAHLGLPFDRDPRIVKQAGWCIVFHEKEDDAVKLAMRPLIEHREKQIGDSTIVKTLDYIADETVPTWLGRHLVASGNVDVRKVPLYVLLIGSPANIPFEFGHLLDVEYCVGRLDFDSPDDYAQYVKSVIDYETGASVPNRRAITFWGPQHKNDKSTLTSSEFLVKPLAQGNADGEKVMERIAASVGKPFETTFFAPEQSTKAVLGSVLRPDGGGPGPAFLFTGSHGMGWPVDDSRQFTASGALLCQDFPGRGLGQLQPEHYFAAFDLPSDARVHGMVAFHFACFGAGTPGSERFTHVSGTAPPQLAKTPFISALPKALLSHRNGGALAVIGHVDRAWTSSFKTKAAGIQLTPYENALAFIMTGLPVGYALKDFNERYASLSTQIASVLERMSFGLPVDQADLVARWIERNDAESYTVLGDPAVQMRVADLQ